MQLRFCVNQAEAFRQGVDSPNSTVQLEVDPAMLDEQTRRLIADRMSGIDVCELEYYGGGETSIRLDYEPVSLGLSVPVKITAKAPTFEALMEAVIQNEQQVQQRKLRREKSSPAAHRAAWARRAGVRG